MLNMKKYRVTMQGPLAGLTARRKSWIKELGLAKIALILISTAICMPYVSAGAYRDLNVTTVQVETPDPVLENHVYDGNDNREETVSYRKQIEEVIPGDNGDKRGGVTIEDLKDISMEKIQRLDEQSLREAVVLLIRERDELKRANEDLNTFLRYNTENNAALTRQIEELKGDVRRLKEDAVDRMKSGIKGTQKVDAKRTKGLLDSITLRDAAHAVYIIHRTPFELLRHHWKFYANVEKSLVRLVTTDIPKVANKCTQFYNDVVVPVIDRVFSFCSTNLETVFVAHSEVVGQHRTMKQDLEDYMINKRNLDPELFSTQQEYDWSLKGVGSWLYPKRGHRHCMYWWHAISKDWKTVIKEKHTVPKHLLGIYVSKIRSLLHRIQMYVLWVMCFLTYFFLNQQKYSQQMLKLETGIRGVYGWFVISPSTIDKMWNASIEALKHYIHSFDHDLEMFYIHLANIYPSFTFVLPASTNERMGMLVLIILLVLVFICLVKFTVRGIIRSMKSVLFAEKRFKSANGGCGRMQNWYNSSFIRWSFNLLQTNQNTAKPQAPSKIRRKLKYLYPHSSEEMNAGTTKKGTEQPHKPVTYWQSVSCRNRGRDTIVVNEPPKDR